MHHRRFVRSFALLALGLASLGVSGCGDPDAPEIARVTGTVTHNGKPVPNLVVNFMPTEGRPSWGITDEEGHYELEYSADYMGAKVGHHKVYVVPNQVSMDGSVQAEGISPEELQAIRQKYGNEQTTQMEVDVTENPQVVDLALD